MTALYVTGYIALTAIVVFLSIKLGKYVDLMDKKSKISGAFIGGVLLAAVTSLPEMFTSISSIWVVHENEMVAGNILGSNLINLTFLGIILISFTKKFRNSRLAPHFKTLLITALIAYALCGIGMYYSKNLQLGWFNIVTPIVLAVYAISVHKTPTTEESSEQDDSTLTLKQVTTRFAIAAVVLIAASVGITYMADYIANLLGMNATVAGALFLGIATSLPELISSITLCKRGNFTASAANIFGSNMFNFAILGFADLISFGKAGESVYQASTEPLLLALFGVISTLAMLVMLIIKEKKTTAKTLPLVACQSLNALPVICYALFLVLSATL